MESQCKHFAVVKVLSTRYGAAALNARVEAEDSADDVGVYVHFPYCLQKCPYCDFNSYAPKTPEPYAPYTAAVLAELDARLHEVSHGRLHSIFFGGGTPSLWDASAVGTIISRIKQAFPRQSAPLEITLEANPGAVERGRLDAFKHAGINRVSMGVQALDDHLLKALGRVHDAEEALGALEIIQRVGFDSHSIDLIYGVPGQTPEAWQRTLDKIVSLATPHVSAYNLIYEPGTKMFSWRQRGAVTPVEERDEVAMFDAACDTFAAAGYAQYEVSNYAKPGHRSTHNRLYWRARSYLGVGAGAHSSTLENGVRVRRECVRDPHGYIAAWSPRRALGLVKDRYTMQENVTRASECDEHIMLGLRTTDGWNAALSETELHIPAIRVATRISSSHSQWCTFDGTHLQPTRLGLKMNDSLILATVQMIDTLAKESDNAVGLASSALGHNGGNGFPL
jgi:putative oxygen-independent coproporphyrinogen III oxidase